MSAATASGFDRGAAVTRSMLGWGVLAGPFYLVFGLILALTRPGFDFGRDALSILLLGDAGWLQALNLVLAGLMTVVAAVGLWRTPGWSRVAAVLVGVYGLGLVLSAFAAPDRPGAGSASVGGILHLAFGGIGFLALGVAAILGSAWFRRGRGGGGRAAGSGSAGAVWSLVAGILVIVAFVAGGALSTGPAGVLLLWIAVVAGWAWLALTCVAAYRAVPHPVLANRAVAA